MRPAQHDHRRSADRPTLGRHSVTVQTPAYTSTPARERPASAVRDVEAQTDLLSTCRDFVDPAFEPKCVLSSSHWLSKTSMARPRAGRGPRAGVPGTAWVSRQTHGGSSGQARHNSCRQLPAPIRQRFHENRQKIEKSPRKSPVAKR